MEETIKDDELKVLQEIEDNVFSRIRLARIGRSFGCLTM